MLNENNRQAAKQLAISYHNFCIIQDEVMGNGGSTYRAPTALVERFELWAGMLASDQEKTGITLITNARWFMERCQEELASRKKADCQHDLDDNDRCKLCGEDFQVHLAMKGAGLL